MQTTSAVHASEVLLFFTLLQLCVIVLAGRLGGAGAKAIGQATAVGEIVIGILLGPSLFGLLAPELFATVFRSTPPQPLTILSQVGLLLLMFQIGLEFDFGHLTERRNRTAVLAVAAGGLVAPFALGLGLAAVLPAAYVGKADPTAFALFVATAMSITALPILGRIMMEFNLTRHPLGVVTISAAAINDVVGWLLLALVTALTSAQLSGGGFSAGAFALNVAMVVVFGALCWWVIRPPLGRFVQRQMAADPAMSGTLMGVVIACIFAGGMATFKLGIFAIFGGFMVGVMLHDRADFVAAWKNRVGHFVNVFFLPIFFTYTGLRTDIGSLGSAEAWGWCAALISVATLGKFGGCYLAARLAGLNPVESKVVGVMMNTRALMELIVINVGYDMGVIGRELFTMLVLMAIFSTLLTTPALRRWLPQLASAVDSPRAVPDGAALTPGSPPLSALTGVASAAGPASRRALLLRPVLGRRRITKQRPSRAASSPRPSSPRHHPKEPMFMLATGKTTPSVRAFRLAGSCATAAAAALLITACAPMPPSANAADAMAMTGTRYPAKPDMQAVLDELAALGGKPIETLTPAEARRQPTPADAVMSLLKKQGKPTDPAALVPGVTSVDRDIPSPAGALPVRIYTPAGAGPFPVVVYFHGGGWVIADKNVYDGGARGLSKQANAVVVSVDYRRAPEAKFPAAWDDSLATYKWAAANASSLNGNPQKLALAGESAGGNLAVSTAVAARDAGLTKPLAIIAVYPVAQTGDLNTASYVDSAKAKPLNKPMIEWFVDKLLAKPADKADPRLDIVNAKLAGLPPVTIVNAQIDPLREDGALLATALQKAGVPVERKVYDGMTHEFFGAAAVVKDAAAAQQYAGQRLQQAFGR